MLYRDRTIPLIDLSAALSLENKNSNNEKQIVIVTEFNNVANGFLVDGVKRIHRLNWGDFVPLNMSIGNNSDSITGSIQIDGAEVMVVDLEFILSVISPSLAISNISDETLNISRSESREKVRVFFAEDSNTIRNKVIRILKGSGYRNLRAFENGQKAFDTLVEIRDKVDAQGEEDTVLPHVMISDIEMPQMDGLTLCRKMKGDSKLKQITVIMFSSLINKQIIGKCESVGADNYITKPEMDKLVSLLDEMCLNSKEPCPDDLVLTN
jgi:two-component system chemotaxis response regulator CheV